MFKKINILRFFIILFLYILPSLFIKNGYDFIDTLTKPSFYPPSFIFIVAWSIIYILMSMLFTYIIDKYGYNNESKSSYLIIFINYILITIFTPIYGPNTLYLGFCIVLLTLVSVIYLMIDLTKLNKKLIFLLIHYLLWLMTALGLSLSLYLLN